MNYTLSLLSKFNQFHKDILKGNIQVLLESPYETINFYKKGNKIHIKKLNRGKFTDYCGGKVTDTCILKGKNSPDPKIRKRATFAANARTWKHKYLLGGIVKKASKSVSKYLLELLRKDPKVIKEIGPVAKLPREVTTLKTKGVGYFVPHTSKLSVRELLGLSKGAYNSLNKYLKLALEDYAYYLMFGKNRWKFIFDPKSNKFRYGTVVQKLRGEVPAVKYIMDLPGSHITDSFARSANGLIAYFFDIGQNRISLIPHGYKFGELRAAPDGNGILKSIVLTSPRVDLKDSLPDASLEELAKLPNRIPKEDMKKFWDYVLQTTKPGTYLSGDAGAMPLGGFMIKAKSPSEAVKLLLKDSADSGIIQRMGLSPDSYKAIIKQGLRPEHRLRFSRNGFTKLNNSAVDNKALYDLWKAASTPELKLQFILDWNNQIYPNSAFINLRGQVEFLQPFVYYMNKGGKFKC